MAENLHEKEKQKGLRCPTVQLNTIVTNELAGLFMVILYRFTVFTQCFVMISNICYKLNLMMFVITTTAHT